MQKYKAYSETPFLWKGTRILLIEAVPPRIRQRTIADILSLCSFEKASSELFFFSGDRADQLSVYLALRSFAPGESQLNEKMDSLSERVQRLLRENRFAVHELAEKEEQKLDQIFTRLREEKTILISPKENLDGGYYSPAGFVNVAPIDLARLANTICHYHHSFFSLQMNCASYLPEEQKIIEENKQFFATPALSQYAVHRAAYESLGDPGNNQLFFSAMLCGGSENCRMDVMQFMLQQGYMSYSIPNPVRSGIVYLADGNNEVCVFAAENAHQLDPADVGAEMRRLNHFCSIPLAERRFVFPASSAEMDGICINDVDKDRSPINAKFSDPDGIDFGTRIGTNSKIYLPKNLLTKHGIAVGMPGCGKTTFALYLLMMLKKKGLPFLIIEPTKREYRTLIDKVEGLKIYTPGRSDISPMPLNPFLPPKGVTLEQFLPSLKMVFAAAFNLRPPLDIIFETVMRNCYASHGWRNTSTRDSKGVRIFGLHEFIVAFREEVNGSSYDKESKDNLLSGGFYRLQSLISSNSTMFDTQRCVPFDEFLKGYTLVELDAIDNVEEKQLIITLLLSNLMLSVRHSQMTDGELKNMVFIDEAHVVLGQQSTSHSEDSADPNAIAVQMLQNMIVAIRAYGTSLFFADQSPRKLTTEVVNNADVKLIFRLDSAGDRQMLSDAVGMDREIYEAIRNLPPGKAYFSCGLLPKPIRLEFPYVNKTENLRDDVSDDEIFRLMNSTVESPYALCERNAYCSGKCNLKCRMEAEYLAHTFSLDKNVKQFLGEKEKTMTFIRNSLDQYVELKVKALEQLPEGVDRTTLSECTKIHFFRRLQLIGPVGVELE